MAKIIAKNGNSIIKVGNGVGLYQSCCCGEPPSESESEPPPSESEPPLPSEPEPSQFAMAYSSLTISNNTTEESPETVSLPPKNAGVGTELKKLLAGWPFKIVATPNCSCNARAAEMNKKGIEWCESNIDTIVGWLKEEAQKRGLPFIDIAAKLMVKRAIRNAKHNQL